MAKIGVLINDLVGTVVVTGPNDGHGGVTSITDDVRSIIESVVVTG